MRCSALYGLVAALIFFLARPAGAQNSEFLFDPSGDLAAQSSESTGPPQIISQPQAEPLIVQPGKMASFVVVLADNTGASYQWQFDGANIIGATSDTLEVTNASATSQGQYTVVVHNSFGSVSSAPAMLWYDGNGDGLPDSWELEYFGTTNITATGDYDTNGVDNLQKFLDGDNPTNPASANYQLTVLNDGGNVTCTPNQTSYTNGQTVVLTATPASSFHAWMGDLLALSNVITVVMTNNMTLIARFTPVDYVWVNTAGGDWNTASNWNFGFAPGADDNAVITNSNVTVTFGTNSDCNNLTLGIVAEANPNLAGSATLTVHGTFNWNSGSLIGTGSTVIAPGATMNVSGNNSVSLANGTLENAGTVVWSSAWPFNVTSAVITNDAGALFYAANSQQFSASDSSFYNTGTFIKNYDSGTTSFGYGLPLYNYGTVEVGLGTLLFYGTFTNYGLVTVAAGATNIISDGGLSSGGAFNAAAGSLVEWNGISGGIFTLTNGAELNGAGLYEVNGGTTLNCNNNVQMQNFNLLTGNLSGSGTMTISGLMNCLGGTISGSGGGFVISESGTMYFSALNMTDWNLENDGTTYWIGDNEIYIDNSIITNAPGALFQAQTSAVMASGGPVCRFDNSGTFQKVTDPGTTAFASGVPFNNYGTADIQAGTIEVTDSGTNNGAITIEAGATLNLFYGPFIGGRASSITGAGALTVGGATAILGGLVNVSGTNSCTLGTLDSTGTYICTNNTLHISGGVVDLSGSGAVSPSVLNMSGGTLGGSDPVTVLNSMLWSGGTIADSAEMLIGHGAILNVSGNVTLSGTLENAGIANWTAATDFIEGNSAIITNDAGALFDVQNSYEFTDASGSCRLDNAGTLRRSTAGGTASFAGFALNNYGKLDIQTGVLSVSDGFTSSPGALLNYEISGTNAGTGYGQLQIFGAVTLNGGLSVVLTNYAPTTGNFTLLTAGAISGAFTSFTFPTNEVSMQVSNSTSSVVASITGVNSNGPPVVTVNLPGALFSYAGRTLSLSVSAVGATPFAFQWEKSGTNVSNTARIGGTQTSTLTITNPLATDSGIYQVVVTNSQGTGQSAACAVTVQAVPKLNTGGMGWTLQGTTTPTMSSNTVTITSGVDNTANSVFYSAPLYIAAFSASFLYTDVGGSGADGITFCLQNDSRGASAVGSDSSGLGYSGITPSAAFELNIYSPDTPGISFQTNGNIPSGFSATTPVNVASGDPIEVSLLYTNNVLQATLVESNTSYSFTTNFTVNLPAVVGGQTAYVGLTGGDGSIASTQVVSNFTFVPLTGISAQAANSSGIALSWPAAIGGYTVQSLTNLNGATGVWQNVTNEIIQGAGRNQVNISPATNAKFYRLSIELSQ